MLVRQLKLACAVAVLALIAACSSSGQRGQTSATSVPTSSSTAASTSTRSTPAGVQHLHFEYGPITITPGQNNIAISGLDIPKPTEDGYIVGIAPNIRRLDGSVPPVDVVHLHHGVWLNVSRPDATLPHLPERFFAAGEEKTALQLPDGFGYPYKTSDRWIINYMLHNLTPNPDQVVITYDMDFVPMTVPAASSIRAARPLWLDVVNGSVYPVFDALRGSGQGGRFTYPDQAPGAPTDNEWVVDRNMVLVSTGGHLHPGGLYNDLDLARGGERAHLFRSEAHYYEPAGAVSWDVSMTVTNDDWRVAVQPGDVLRVSTTYDTARASWYESMGIMVVWAADGTDGADPFVTPVDAPGRLTHDHLPENDNHGGEGTEAKRAEELVAGTAPSGQVGIIDFTYGAGDLTIKTAQSRPVLQLGQSMTFRNDDQSQAAPIWHTITACRAPCNGATGIAYPLADGDIQFDSGQLGSGGPPTAGRLTWTTPSDLPAGTYTYFCRVHPFMRGAFEVTSTK